MTTFTASPAFSKNQSQRLVFDFLTVFAGSLFLALCAQISIGFWITPVPLSMQTFGVLLIGATLGKKRGALAILTYITEAALGAPILAKGLGGLPFVLGTDCGYLFGFVLCAYCIGYLFERGWNRHYGLTLAAFLIGSTLTTTLGAVWLSTLIGWELALKFGVYPFIPGDLLKIVAATAILPVATRYVGPYLRR